MTFTGSNDELPVRAIGYAIHRTKAEKPNDRSEKDRAYAVTITKLEEAYAYFLTFAATDEIRRILELAGQVDQETP
jgi:hypothetical protein